MMGFLVSVVGCDTNVEKGVSRPVDERSWSFDCHVILHIVVTKLSLSLATHRVECPGQRELFDPVSRRIYACPPYSNTSIGIIR